MTWNSALDDEKARARRDRSECYGEDLSRSAILIRTMWSKLSQYGWQRVLTGVVLVCVGVFFNEYL